MKEDLLQGELLFLIIVGILVMTSLALALVLFFNFSQKRILKEKMLAKDMKIKHQQEMLYRTIVIQEKERKRIAKDLHDDIGSKLNVINLNLHRLKKQGKESEKIQAIAVEVQDLIGNTINTTRRISHDLLPPTLESFGLKAALQELADGFNRSGKVEVSVKVPIMEQRPAEMLVELNLFRVVQELISNSLRHGKANKIDLDLTMKKEHINLHYQDNGQGFDTSQLNEKKGLGSSNIDSRLNMVGGTIAYDSAPGKGTKVFIQLKI
ncbi:MAG: sensor histidine kinase [Bacteroidota bacterium]